MNPRFFNPRSPGPPPRSFRPPNPQFQSNSMSSFNSSYRGHQQPQNYQPQMSEYGGNQMTRKRHLNPPEPPKFSDLAARDEPKQMPAIPPDYKAAVDQEVRKLDDKFKAHTRDPESHPFYGKEWQLFWNRKADELAKRGEDPSDYDFHEEWCEFFIDRIRELYDEEIKWKIDQLRRKFNVSGCDYPPLKKAKSHDDNLDDKNDTEDDDDEYQQYADINQPQWDMQASQMTDPKRKRQSRFDQPPSAVDEAKFKPNPGQFMQQSAPRFNLPNSGIRPLLNVSFRAGIKQPFQSELKKPKRDYEKVIQTLVSTIRLDNVPSSMRIPAILDFFCNKFRGIIGCFRATDYISKISSKAVYVVLMDEKEVEAMAGMKEIIMEGSYVKISALKLLTGSASIDATSPEVPGAPQSLFITGLEKRTVETTFYLREIAKQFDSQMTVTGVRICHSGKIKKTRNFGFVNFISKASVDEFDGRGFKMFDYEIRANQTHKIPILINAEHLDIMNNDPLLWSNQVRGLNLLNIDM